MYLNSIIIIFIFVGCDAEIRGNHLIHVQLKLTHTFYISIKQSEFQK